ncbi:hypothetical protein SAMN04487912_11488 [Arthrobacter sp. cf158]|nr:hypothetical protein SAMN04487912_11488 [Arthrobacter sp. cf158]
MRCANPEMTQWGHQYQDAVVGFGGLAEKDKKSGRSPLETGHCCGGELVSR